MIFHEKLHERADISIPLSTRILPTPHKEPETAPAFIGKQQPEQVLSQVKSHLSFWTETTYLQ